MQGILVLLDGETNLENFTNIPPHSRLTRDQALAVWKKSIGDLYYPPLGDPMIVFIENDPEPFGISSDNWTTKLNLAYIPPIEILSDNLLMVWFEYAIVKHEINHYLHFPYDRMQSLKCIRSIYEVLKDLTGVDVYTKTVLYPFLADIIVDTDLLRIYGDVIIWATRIWFQYNFLMNPACSTIALTRMRTFEKYWGVNLGCPKEGLQNPDVDEYSNGLVKALGSYVDYPDLAQKFAEVLRPLLLKEMPPVSRDQNICLSMDQFQAQSQGQGSNQSTLIYGGWDDDGDDTNEKEENEDTNSNNTSGNNGNETESENGTKPKEFGAPIDNGVVIRVPADFLLQIKESPDKVKSRTYVQNGAEDATATEDRDLMINVSVDLTNPTEFVRVLEILDLHIPEEDEFRMFLRARAYGLLRYEPRTLKHVGEVKHYPINWSPEDPIEQLDLIKSYQNFPVAPIIPPFSKKWKYTAGSYGSIEMGVRNLVLVIDSSASMWLRLKSEKEENRGPFYYAMMAAEAVLLAAIEKEAEFCVVNFSTRVIQTKWLRPGVDRDLRKAEDIIGYHQNGTTLIPGSHIVKKVKAKQSPCYIPIFSDSDIWNIDKNIPYMEGLKRRGHSFSLFLMGHTEDYRIESDRLNRLLDVCDTFHVIEDYTNLVGLVVSDVRNFY